MSREFDPTWEDGIRSLRSEEFDGLRALLGEVFRPSLVEEYPHFYRPENAGLMRVAVVDGQIVSHIGTLRRDASICGCTVRVASLGGVATYEKDRKNGYATALFEDTMRDCREDGVDFMLVSGYRKMYHRYGCRYVGRDWQFKLTAEDATGLNDDGLELLDVTTEDLPAIAEVYRREPVRWMRPLSDYEYATKSFVMNRPSAIHIVCKGGNLQGYCIIQVPREQDGGRSAILEAAGDRKSLIGSLGSLFERYGLCELRLHVLGSDRPMLDLLRERGLHGEPANSSGTATLINFTQFMDRMRPTFAEIVGPDAAQGMLFREAGDEYHFHFGGDCVVAQNRGQAVELIFGTLDDREEEILKGAGRAEEVFREVFPIPSLWYGINYL